MAGRIAPTCSLALLVGDISYSRDVVGCGRLYRRKEPVVRVLSACLPFPRPQVIKEALSCHKPRCALLGLATRTPSAERGELAELAELIGPGRVGGCCGRDGNAERLG